MVEQMKRKNIKESFYIRNLGLAGLLILFLLVIMTVILNGCSALAPRTGALQGIVHRETASGSSPIENALISVSGSNNTAQTAEDGHFFINEISAGKRTLTVVKEGYVTLQLVNIYIEPEIVNEVNFGEPIILKAKEDQSLFDTAWDAYQAEDYQFALTIWQELLSVFPESLLADDAQYYIAWCHISLEDFVKAVTEFENLLISYPASEYADDAQYYIGWCHEKKLGLPIPAILAYYTLLFDYPDSQWADDTQLGIGNCYYATDDYGNAITEYQKVIDNYPWSALLPLARYSIAQSYRMANYRTTAIEKYQELILFHPESDFCGPAQYYIGYCYYEKNEYLIAIAEFQKGIDDYPNSTWPDESRLVAPSAQFYIGWCYEQLENWEEALVAYQLVIDNYQGSTFSNGSSITAYSQERIDWINDTYFPELPG